MDLTKLAEIDVKVVIEYGVLGLVCFAFLKGWIVPGWIYKQKEEENKELRETVQEFTPLMKLALQKLNSMKVRKGGADHEGSDE